MLEKGTTAVDVTILDADLENSDFIATEWEGNIQLGSKMATTTLLLSDLSASDVKGSVTLAKADVNSDITVSNVKGDVAIDLISSLGDISIAEIKGTVEVTGSTLDGFSIENVKGNNNVLVEENSFQGSGGSVKGVKGSVVVTRNTDASIFVSEVSGPVTVSDNTDYNEIFVDKNTGGITVTNNLAAGG